MSFANQRNILIHDRLGNLYNFRWDEEKIIYTYFDKYFKKFDKNILVEDATLEFDAGIDEQDQAYFVYQRKDGNMVLMSSVNGFWHENVLGGDGTLNVLNLNMFIYHKQIHIIYCVPAYENEMMYRIYHHYYDGQEWKTSVLQDIRRKNLLNPFQIIKNEKKLFVGFYNLTNNEEQIFIKAFDIENLQWENAIQLTSGSSNRLYLDMLMTDLGTLHLTFSEYVHENLVIKYEKYKFENNKAIKIFEAVLSNPANCSHPILIKEHEKLWNVWTEYDQVVSSFTTDEGRTWSDPCLWKESKEIDFFCYKFNTNDENISANYQFNYTFGKDYPGFSFIGFGPLDKTVKMPLKKSKKKEEDCIVEFKEEDKIENPTSERNDDEVYHEEIEKLHQNMQNLEERMQNIEEYLKRRRRGILFSSRK